MAIPGKTPARVFHAAALALWIVVALAAGTGARRANPGLATAANDLALVEAWQRTGLLESHPTDPSHLTKPGYVALLRLLLPGRGASEAENRRFLAVNAALFVLGAGALGVALARRAGPASAPIFLAGIAIFLPLRDGADYVGSETIASGLGMLAAACWILGRPGRRAWLAAAGVLAAILTTIRPNVGLLLVGLALAVRAGSPRTAGARWTSALAFLAALLIALGFLRIAGDRTHGLDKVSRILMWGTADYYWRFDLGAWPTDPVAGTLSRLQLETTAARWRELFRSPSGNRNRSLEWRMLHGLFAADELPSRWSGPRYLALDADVRRWWWVGAVLLAAASVAAAVSSRSEFRWAAFLVVGVVVTQSLTCGADPRLALPMIPFLAAGIAAALPSLRWSPAALGAAIAVGMLLAWRAVRIPDLADCDFALVRGSGRTIEEVLPAGRVPPEPRRLHFRLLQEPPFAEGFVASIDGRVALRREPGDPSPFPAYFSANLTADEAARSPRSGLRLSVTTLPWASPDDFLYFPLSPPALGLRCTVDGSERVPSAFFGQNRGGWPVWVTAD